MKRYICLHGHFYQPPRENPWFETVEVQDSAYPFHDWNERVSAECYAPNSAARILDDRGHIVNILNNYSRISFNFGATLLSWLQARDPEVYAAILQADRDSQRRFSGHGSALAQAYNHMILPLATRRDKATQVRWGLADFRHRFGREPEGMWLPETAVDVETLEVLAEHSLKLTILAPHQVSRMRRKGERTWHDVSGGRIDPTQPYEARLPSGRRLALFFYDGPISRAVAFERLLSSGAAFLQRLAGGFSDQRPWDQLVHIATDGETYGHHHRFGEMALAWVLDRIERERSFQLTNYGELLARHPPTCEVEIAPNTSWSCAHGVERWRSDCGCSGGHAGWNQAWRAPLRQALDWLRDRVGKLFEDKGRALLADPWQARDAYVEVVLDRTPERVQAFLERHAARLLSQADRVVALKLLEMQRHAMLMYTSCGWFFDDISGIETVQVLQYAGRAVQLAQEFSAEALEPQLLERLARAPSNDPELGDGAAVYAKLVKPAMSDLYSVAAHYAISSLFERQGERASVMSYQITRRDYRRAEAGRARLAVGHLSITSEVTAESADLSFGVLHLGDHNLSGGVGELAGNGRYQAMVAEVTGAFARADLPAVLRLLDRHLELTYSLKSLLRDEQRTLLGIVLDSTLAETAALYRQLYENQAPLMRYLADLEMPLPQVLRSTAEFVLNTELRRALGEEELPLERVRKLLDEATHFGVRLDGPGLGFVLRRTLIRLAERLTAAPREFRALQALTAAAGLAVTLPFEVDLWKVQNAYFHTPRDVIVEMRLGSDRGEQAAADWLTCFTVLGELLRVQIA